MQTESVKFYSFQLLIINEIKLRILSGNLKQVLYLMQMYAKKFHIKLL